MDKDLEKGKRTCRKRSRKIYQPNQVIGLGTGSTAYYVIKEIGDAVKNGLNIKAVPTSEKTVRSHCGRTPSRCGRDRVTVILVA